MTPIAENDVAEHDEAPGITEDFDGRIDRTARARFASQFILPSGCNQQSLHSTLDSIIADNHIGVIMVRVRVHSQFVSLDGYSAGDYVTFDEPIGGAQALFGWFDGQGIEGIGGVDGPVTLDRALFAMWGQGIGAEIMGRKKFGPQEGRGPMMGGAAGGARNRRSRLRALSLLTILGSRWNSPMGRAFISSMPPPRRS